MAIHDSAQRAAAATAAPSGPPFDPMALNRPAIAARSALKIAVLNVAGGANLDAIAACLMRPPLADVGALMVCEASWRMPRHKSVEFAPALAAALKMSFVFLPSFGRIDSRNGMRALGNAILSARPLDDFQAIELPKPPNISKQLYLAGIHQGLLASINVDGRQVTLGVVHLERVWDPEGRNLQMESFLSGIGDKRPIIIGGDFNTTTLDMDRRWGVSRAAAALVWHPKRFREPRAREPLFDRIREHGFSLEGANLPAVPTFTLGRWVPPIWRPKLDWIAARGIQPVKGSAAVVPARTSLMGRRVSDHDFVLCEFRL